jgi:hypothetical protein
VVIARAQVVYMRKLSYMMRFPCPYQLWSGRGSESLEMGPSNLCFLGLELGLDPLRLCPSIRPSDVCFDFALLQVRSCHLWVP